MSDKIGRAVYTARYTYDGANWVVQFDDPDISTYGRTLDKAMTAAREALAVTLGYDDVPALQDGVEIEDRVRAKGVSDDALLGLRRTRHEIEKQLEQIASQTAVTAETLVKAGLSYRDAAAAVGISHQRVAQLVRSSSSKKVPTRADS